MRNWLQEELPFMLRERPRARATVVVAGLPHGPGTEVIVAPPVTA